MEEEWRKCDRNEGMEEYVYLAHRRGMMEEQRRSFQIEGYRRKCERKEGMEEDVVKRMEEERWKCMMYEWNGGDEELYGRVQKEVCDEQIKGGGR